MPTDIKELINTCSIVAHFQPVVSIKKRAVVGLEALARGLDGPFRLLAPETLFTLADEAQLTDALDDLCRNAALTAFAAWPQKRGQTLFLNLKAQRQSQGGLSAGTIRKAVEEAGLRTHDVVLELSDRDIDRNPAMRTLIQACQSFGFGVALDDLDGSPAGLRRLAELKPDIAKADASLLQGLSADPVKQVLLQTVASLARRQGALTVAEGVETEEDACLCVDLGADLLQGFHYGRPQAADKLTLTSPQAAVERSAGRVKASLAGRSQQRQRENERHLQLLQRIRQALHAQPPAGFDAVLGQFVNAVASLECLYVMDPKGQQVTPTVVWQHHKDPQRNGLFAPAEAGADHSLKDYFLGLTMEARETHVSEPYVSLATGNLCRTLSTRFDAALGGAFILCMDIRSA